MAKKYIADVQNQFSTGRELSCWIKAESVRNQFEDTIAATDLCRVTADLTPVQNQVMHDDEQRRGGSRSRRDPITGRIDHGTMTLEHYFKPSGTPGTPPEASVLVEASVGGSRVVNAGAADAIAGVTSATRDQTVLTFAGGLVADYTIGDGVMLLSNNNDYSGPADGELRYVTAIDTGTNTLTIRPGFSKRPRIGGTPDEIQPGVAYYLTEDFTTSYSMLVEDGMSWFQLIGCSIEDLQMSINGRDPFKMTHSVGFRERVVCGEDQVRGVAGVDSFLTTDTVLDVGDAKKFDIGAYINLDTDAAGTETKARVTDRDVASNPNNITIVRGTGALAIGDLTADTAIVDRAGPYLIPANGRLRCRIDNKTWVEIPITAGAARTATQIETDVDTYLRDSQYYGFNTEGHTNVDWENCGRVVGSAFRLVSPLWGSNSRIQLAPSVGGTTVHHVIFNLFAIQSFSSTGNEVRIVGWTPGETETGEPIHNKVGWFYMDGYKFGVVRFDITVNNNVKWLEEEKIDSDYASGFAAVAQRTVEGQMEFYYTGKTISLFYDAVNSVDKEGCIQVGKTAGYAFGSYFPRFRVYNLQTSGEEERRATVDLKFFASAVYEDELWLCAV